MLIPLGVGRLGAQGLSIGSEQTWVNYMPGKLFDPCTISLVYQLFLR